jgi:curved DNA-binding protein
MAFIDYYKIMGIPRDTPQSEMRAAYMRRAKQFHPDLHPDDPKAKAKFQALGEAYAVLGDPEKRKKYDQYGEHWQEASAGENAGFGSGGADFDNFDFSGFNRGGSGFSSFFEELFGGGGGHSGFSFRSRRMDRGAYDAQATVNIDMYTALLGGEILLQTSTSKLKLRVRPGTQNGARVRLKGKGYDRGDGTFGDLIITYNVKLPTQLSPRQQELLKQMREG